MSEPDDDLESGATKSSVIAAMATARGRVVHRYPVPEAPAVVVESDDGDDIKEPTTLAEQEQAQGLMREVEFITERTARAQRDLETYARAVTGDQPFRVTMTTTGLGRVPRARVRRIAGLEYRPKR